MKRNYKRVWVGSCSTGTTFGKVYLVTKTNDYFEFMNDQGFIDTAFQNLFIKRSEFRKAKNLIPYLVKRLTKRLYE